MGRGPVTHPPLPHVLGMSGSLEEKPKDGCALRSPRAQRGTADHLGLGWMLCVLLWGTNTGHLVPGQEPQQCPHLTSMGFHTSLQAHFCPWHSWLSDHFPGQLQHCTATSQHLLNPRGLRATPPHQAQPAAFLQRTACQRIHSPVSSTHVRILFCILSAVHSDSWPAELPRPGGHHGCQQDPLADLLTPVPQRQPLLSLFLGGFSAPCSSQPAFSVDQLAMADMPRNVTYEALPLLGPGNVHPTPPP